MVTGAYGYSGMHIAARLLTQGYKVRTLTGAPQRASPFGDQVPAYSYRFEDPEALARALRGARVLYNTYWVRFEQAGVPFAEAVRNSRKLFAAARQAGVERVVHTSITNPSLDSDLGYFRGKAQVERALIRSGLSYAILRPAVFFGGQDILINNIAWALRRLPLFGVFGDGSYRLQPIHVEDFAALAVEQGARRGAVILDAIGPETFSYRGLVAHIAATLGKPRPILRLPPAVGQAALWLIGRLVGDVILTGEEIEALMAGLLCTDSPPVGETRLTDWVEAHANSLGTRYRGELARRQDRHTSYDRL
jgi:NADH dehydrogenase